MDTENTQNVGLVENGAALLSMRNSDFDVYSAYGEVVDNAVQAESTAIKIRMEYKPKSPSSKHEPIQWIAFGDNGHGMPPEVLHRCLQLGYSSRFNDRRGIGRFGVGATLAAINQCKKIEVYSKQQGGKWLYTYVDLDMVTSSPPTMLSIPSPLEREPTEEFDELIGEESGTLVIWSHYDRQPTDASEILEELKIWLGRTYRKFIWKGVSISVNGESVFAIDPLYVTTQGTQFPNDPPAHEFKPMTISWSIPREDQHPGGSTKSDITIRMSLLPEQFRPNKGAGNSKENENRSISRNNGISIMRNDREVYYDTIPHWPRERFAEIDRWWGCEISFQAILDKEFTVKNIKRGALPVKMLKEALADSIEPTRQTALERVREVWGKAAAASIGGTVPGKVHTGHEAAEQAAQNTPVPKNVLDQGKDLDSETKRFTQEQEWLENQDERQKALWQAKFQSQPFTIIDAEWRGPEFVETNHLGGNDVLRYNMRHRFFTEIEAVRQSLSERGGNDPDANKLRILIDLLLISYAKAEAMIDPKHQWTPERLLEELRMNWGNYLKNYIETYNRESSTT